MLLWWAWTPLRVTNRWSPLLLCLFWCPAEHSFHFRVGSMVPTMMDVVALTGLPCTGETAYAGMSVPYIEYHRPKSAGKPGFITAYGTFIDTCMKSDSSISEEEHISFLSCWLNRYLCCSPTLAMTADFVDPARVLHSGRRVALAPLALSYLYRGMNEVLLTRWERYSLLHQQSRSKRIGVIRSRWAQSHSLCEPYQSRASFIYTFFSLPMGLKKGLFERISE